MIEMGFFVMKYTLKEKLGYVKKHLLQYLNILSIMLLKNFQHQVLLNIITKIILTQFIVKMFIDI